MIRCIGETDHTKITEMIANKTPLGEIAASLGVSISTLYRYMRKYMTSYVCEKRMKKNARVNRDRGLAYLAQNNNMSGHPKENTIPKLVCHTRSPCIHLDRIPDTSVLFSTPKFDLSDWRMDADIAIAEIGEEGHYLLSANLRAVLLDAITDINTAARRAAAICRREGIVVEET